MAEEFMTTPAGAPAPVWTVGHANIWIDHTGCQHWSRYTHGSVFPLEFEQVYGHEPGLVEDAWMMEHVGSLPDEDEVDNPGWQWVELAKARLGWIRCKATCLRGKPALLVSYGEAATGPALMSAAALVAAMPQAVVELGCGNAFQSGLSAGHARISLNAIATRPGQSAKPPDTTDVSSPLHRP